MYLEQTPELTTRLTASRAQQFCLELSMSFGSWSPSRKHDHLRLEPESRRSSASKRASFKRLSKKRLKGVHVAQISLVCSGHPEKLIE